jgi:hypothetical protein
MILRHESAISLAIDACRGNLTPAWLGSLPYSVTPDFFFLTRICQCHRVTPESLSAVAARLLSNTVTPTSDSD